LGLEPISMMIKIAHLRWCYRMLWNADWINSGCRWNWTGSLI